MLDLYLSCRHLQTAVISAANANVASATKLAASLAPLQEMQLAAFQVVCVGVSPPRELHLPALLEYVPAGHEAHTAEDTASGTATRHHSNKSLRT